MSSLQHPPCPSVPRGLNKSLSDFGGKPINDVINYETMKNLVATYE